jgi:SAM-dependent methyltransferase
MSTKQTPATQLGPDATTHDRLLALLDHLGLARAFFGAPMAGDIASIAATAPERVAGLVLMTPMRLDPAPFAGLTERLLMVSSERGMTAETTGRAAKVLPAAARHIMAGYEALGWADVVADRTEEVADTVLRFLGRLGERGAAAVVPRGGARSGTHAGISYRMEGRGPALVLLPFFLAPSQWDPALPKLAQHFTTIVLGGAHLGGVATLEDRASAPSYRALFRSLVDLLAPAPGERILDVGCGSGALDRLLAKRVAGANAITAVDVNPFLLREAAGLADSEGLGHAIAFRPGSAESLPFAEASFDCAFSVTVLEECDADKALAELVRVVRPGGRVGVVVRAIDMPQWWSLDVPAGLKARIAVPPQSVAPKGVADKSLYARMRRAGLDPLTAFPSLVTLDNPAGPIWRFREDHVLSQMSAEERKAWDELREAASRDGLLLAAHAMHCAVGVRA